MIRTYIYKIKTNAKFIDKFNQWIGTCRFLYNNALELKIMLYKGNKVSISNYDISKQLTEAKKEIPWLKDVHSQTLQAILDRLDNAYKSFFRKKIGFPKFASRHKWRSIPFKAIKFQDNKFILPKFGFVSVFKDRLPEGELKTASIVRKADGYYLHVQIELETIENTNENQVGIDMGVSYFAVTSDNIFINNPKHLSRYANLLRIENRSLARKVRGSERRKKQVHKLQLLYLKITRVREDFLHKESTKLSKQYGTIFMENLNIAKMVKDSYFSKNILDCGWSKFKQLLSYKANVVLVNPAYTSQICNECGHTAKTNRISQSEFVCINCGNIENADYNASKNIKCLGKAIMRQSRTTSPNFA